MAAEEMRAELTAPVLVTGATGFTGSCLALRLARSGVSVRALARSRSKTDALRDAGISIAEGDIRDADAVMRAAAGVARIYHIAAVFRTAGHPDSYYHEVNVAGTANVLAAARENDVSRTIHCSTIGVHGDVRDIPCSEGGALAPSDIYQETKLAAEQLARSAFDQGLPGVVFRPAGIYGPGDLRFLKLFQAIQKHRFVMIGSGKTLWHGVYIDDLIDGILLCGEHPAALGEVFILAGPSYSSLDDLAATIAAAVGVSAPRWHVPYGPALLAARLCEAACRPIGIEPPLHRRRMAFFAKDRAFTSEKAERLLGYQPKVGLAEGVARTTAWYREQGLLR